MIAAANPAKRLLLSIGDPNGIGPEIAMKAVAQLPTASPVVVGDAHVLAEPARRAGLELRPVTPDEPPNRSPRGGVCEFIEAGALSRGDHRIGAVTAAGGAATIAYVTTAVRLAAAGGYAGVVACPHSETAVHRAGIAFAGYPPLLATLTETPTDRVFLMLVGGGIRVAHVTLHERLADSLARLTPELVGAAGIALAAALTSMGIDRPRIGVFGINPHAGEDGLFGSDDREVTEPAVATLRAGGIDADGPIGADVLLGGQREHDAYLAMYHDQGHIPVKALAGRTSAAVTIGAGTPFASVGHGPGFDIAGTDRADPAALLAALRLMTPNRKAV